MRPTLRGEGHSLWVASLKDRLRLVVASYVLPMHRCFCLPYRAIISMDNARFMANLLKFVYAMPVVSDVYCPTINHVQENNQRLLLSMVCIHGHIRGWAYTYYIFLCQCNSSHD